MKSYTIKELEEKLNDIYTIHYACGNFNLEEKDEQRITAIVVLDNEDNPKLFSLKKAAETLNIDLSQNNFNKLEKYMLKDFYNYCKGINNSNKNALWLHWRMSTNKFGFEVLEHRYRVLVKHKLNEEYKITKQSQIDLVNILNLNYGTEFADDPKMKNLMLLNNNNKLHRNFLEGKDEVKKYSELKFNAIHTSTEFKVFWIKKVYKLIIQKKLKTKNTKNKINLILEKIVDNYYIKTILIVMALLTFSYNFFLKN